MLYWIRYPCIRITVSFACGILWCQYIPIPLLLTCIVFIVSVISYSLVLTGYRRGNFYRVNLLVSLLAFVCLFLLGCLCRKARDPFHRKTHLAHVVHDYEYYMVLVADAVDSSGRYVTFPVNALQIYAGGQWRPAEGKVIVFLQHPVYIDFHDILLIKGRPQHIPPPLNPDEFDYRRFMQHKGIAFRHFIRPGDLVNLGTGSSFSMYGASLKVRRVMAGIITTKFRDPATQGILLALLTGQRDYIDPGTYNAFIVSGVVHTLAVSGLHVGIIYLFLLVLLKPFHRNAWSRKISFLVKIGVLIFFACLTGLSPSVLRATLMFSIMAMGKVVARHSPTLNSVFLSAFILMGIDPFLLFELGFQLSYAAVTGIILFQPMIYSLLRTKYYLLDWVWKLSSVSIAAQLATLPLTLFYFRQFPTYFLIGNLIAIPFISLLIIGGILLVMASFTDEIAGFLVPLLKWISQIFLRMISWVQSLPYSLIQPIPIDIYQAGLLSLAAIALFLSLRRRNAPMFVTMCILLAGVFLIDLHSYSHYRQNQKIVVYNVPGISCVELVCGHEGIMIIGDRPGGSPSAEDFHTRNNIIRERRTTKKCYLPDLPGFIPSRNIDGLVLLSWNGRSVGILYDTLDMDRLKPYALDYLIISNDALEISELEGKDLGIRQVIWDSSCRKMKENDYLGHHVGIQGPFIDHLK